ncbi:uncharacterized protein NECHADRAFT_64595 [Fusarium vanettenii 77-13-4]|uniref:Vacuolar iron transporter Ccc1 n=1 Tax=Fusarium vanettenii (strain ATCC MYA-4622 / CBS 123669 / FGSC 9596 / NRRL 45880 / 77-13-4) TaxID=660122 RepID=C7ZIV1_FUSV7|nr:uncharacterized protein NECHADRAFT_64595 [Fusarium vanettenii 77-13-4]EEU36150.1 hypothetical protein NECHADRAFT_64595 [Fusarium vanettenii 77-13-4]
MKFSQSPASKRFLSDFTLGFSDGLTVPFALTAGLSSLGKTDTVISGGLAELCAGSISMGIGGYLAARDEVPSQTCRQSDSVDDEEMRGILSYESNRESDDISEPSEKSQSRAEELVRLHLEPLGLPHSAIISILSTLQEESTGLERAALRLQSYREDTSSSSACYFSSPIISGLSISLGYAVGGTIPLFPYFFASTVGLGLQWSIGLCLVVLFGFGFGKSWILKSQELSVRGCLFEGLQMLILGVAAAVVAVACVRLVGETS